MALISFFKFEDSPEIDFLELETVSPNLFIVTNPPFSLMKEFIRKCVSLGNPFAILAKLDLIASAYFKDIYDEYGANMDIIIMSPKLFFTHEGTEMDVGKCVWIVKGDACNRGLSIV